MAELCLQEVFALAVEQERLAGRFYGEAAPRVRDDACRRVLENLSRMERIHETRLIAWAERLAASRPGGIQDRPADICRDVAASASPELAGLGLAPDTRLTGRETTEQVLEIAIRLEERAIQLFAAIRQRMAREDDRKEVDGLIAEENQHRSLLNEQLVVQRARGRAGMSPLRRMIASLFDG